MKTPTLPGRVIISHGDICTIETRDKIKYKCFNRRKVGSIVCGDLVDWEPQDDKSGIIKTLKPRQTELSRLDRSGKPKPIAANFDQLIITLAIKPKPDPFMIDSYLAFAEQFNIKCSILLNKTDLIDEENQQNINHLIDLYNEIGYRITSISIKQKHNIEQLNERLNHHTSILVGQSGVGKSSIINFLLPDSKVQVGELSALNGLGSHTTTTTILYHLPNGGELIDSPGVRQFTPDYPPIEIISYCFKEFRNYDRQCKFNNCTHLHEPKCAIINAVENKEINQSRYASYIKIIKSLKNENRS